jgi:hypothetical protein
MKESILHYVWQFKLFAQDKLQTTEGVKVEIIDVGKPNCDAGPDFFNAKLRIDNILWAGNIEIHSRSSDWDKHGHQTDKAYKNVILHVVKTADAEVYNFNNEKVPQLELHYPEHIDRNYEQLLSEKKWIPCADKLNAAPQIVVSGWKNALLGERLMQKTKVIEDLLTTSAQHWEEVFYITLARNFGFGVNSQAFEALAKSLPLIVLGKHKDSLRDIEALLFGQSGLLPESGKDPYCVELKQTYGFLRKKYGLQAIDASQWKLLRLRPDNFPHIRIAQFAALVHSSSKLFSKIIENPDINYLRKLFACRPSDYWKTHYTFERESPPKAKQPSAKTIDILLINTVAPFLFYYGDKKQQHDYKDKALSLLEELPAERNAVIDNWAALGVTAASACDSQALLQLKKEYCDNKKCLRCRIGHKVLQREETSLEFKV